VRVERRNVPHLSSGCELSAAAGVVFAFKLPERLVAQAGVQVMLVVIGDPGFQDLDQLKGTGPFLEPQAFFFEVHMMRSVSALPFGLL
jgi:hypothetical protein